MINKELIDFPKSIPTFDMQPDGEQIFEVLHRPFMSKTVMVYISDDIRNDINFNYSPVILSRNGFPYDIEFVSLETLKSHKKCVDSDELYQTYDKCSIVAFIAPENWSMKYVSKNYEIKEIC